MKKLTLISTLLITSVITSLSNAAVLIQTRDAQHQITTIYIEGNRARIDMPHNEGYVVIDIAQRIMNIISHHNQTIIDMSEFLHNTAASTAPTKYIDTYTKTMGLGPTIIGYETEEYALYANNNYCGSLYVSVNAIRDMGVNKFIDAFTNMKRNMAAKMAALTGANLDQHIDPCVEAERKATQRARNMGFPLKRTDRNKRLDSEVIKINKNAHLPTNAFSIPSHYKMATPSSMMNSGMKDMHRAQPHMQETMKHMTPEMRHMIQQQMQQYPH